MQVVILHKFWDNPGSPAVQIDESKNPGFLSHAKLGAFLAGHYQERAAKLLLGGDNCHPSFKEIFNCGFSVVVFKDSFDRGLKHFVGSFYFKG